MTFLSKSVMSYMLCVAERNCKWARAILLCIIKRSQNQSRNLSGQKCFLHLVFTAPFQNQNWILSSRFFLHFFSLVAMRRRKRMMEISFFKREKKSKEKGEISLFKNSPLWSNIDLMEKNFSLWHPRLKKLRFKIHCLSRLAMAKLMLINLFELVMGRTCFSIVR